MASESRVDIVMGSDGVKMTHGSLHNVLRELCSKDAVFVRSAFLRSLPLFQIPSDAILIAFTEMKGSASPHERELFSSFVSDAYRHLFSKEWVPESRHWPYFLDLVGSQQADLLLNFKPPVVEVEATTLQPELDSSVKKKQILKWLTWKSSELAIGITMLGHADFLRMAPGELLAAPRPWLDRQITRFRQLSDIISFGIVNASSSVDAIKKAIRIAQAFLDLRDYHHLAAVLAGLNSVSVQSLKKVWEDLPAKLDEQFKKLEQLVSPMRNFRDYRTTLSECPKDQPCYPYLALMLKDAVYINDGNPSWMEVEVSPGKTSRLLNFEKVSLLGALLESCRSFQAHTYAKVKNDPKLDVWLQEWHVMVPANKDEDADFALLVAEKKESFFKKIVTRLKSEPGSPNGSPTRSFGRSMEPGSTGSSPVSRKASVPDASSVGTLGKRASYALSHSHDILPASRKNNLTVSLGLPSQSQSTPSSANNSGVSSPNDSPPVTGGRRGASYLPPEGPAPRSTRPESAPRVVVPETTTTSSTASHDSDDGISVIGPERDDLDDIMRARELAEFLSVHGLSKYAHSFEAIPKSQLKTLTETNLIDLGISKADHRTKILEGLSLLRAMTPKDNSPQGSPKVTNSPSAAQDVDFSVIRAVARGSKSLGRLRSIGFDPLDKEGESGGDSADATMTGSPLRRTKRSSKLRGSMDFIPTPETVAAPAVVGGGPDVLSSPARRKKVRKGRKYTRSVDNSAKIHAADALDPSKSEISGNTDGVTAPNADSLVPSDSESRSCSKCVAALGRAPQFFSESGAALCSSCHAESQRVICWRCKHGVENPLRAMDQLWHDECFYCEQCKGSITGSFLEVDGLPYHMDCAPEDEDGPVEASGGDDGASNHHVPSSTVVESSPAATVQGQVGVDRLTLVCTYNGTTLSLKFPEDVSLMRVLIDVSDAFHVSDLTLQMMDFEGDLITIKKQADWDYVLMSTLSRGQTILHIQVKQD